MKIKMLKTCMVFDEVKRTDSILESDDLSVVDTFKHYVARGIAVEVEDGEAQFIGIKVALIPKPIRAPGPKESKPAAGPKEFKPQRSVLTLAEKALDAE